MEEIAVVAFGTASFGEVNAERGIGAGLAPTGDATVQFRVTPSERDLIGGSVQVGGVAVVVVVVVGR